MGRTGSHPNECRAEFSRSPLPEFAPEGHGVGYNARGTTHVVDGEARPLCQRHARGPVKKMLNTRRLAAVTCAYCRAELARRGKETT